MSRANSVRGEIMQLADVLRLIAEHQEEIRRSGVRFLAVFGSVARGEAGPESDVDILVEYDQSPGYFEFFDLEARLEEILGCSVDLFTPSTLREEARTRILKEAIRAA